MDSVYRAVVEAPEGVRIAVEPETLVFNSSTKKLGFKTDGTRNVVIPLSVRTRVSMP
ncbi:hypothetical protein YC2023_001330 [Brassica napus]